MIKWIASGTLALMLFGCTPAKKTGYRIFVANETSGDMTVIDSVTLEVIATAPLGKRPRGMHASPDGKFLYVALSGTPPAPPGVDEDTLPPPDKTADGIAIFDTEKLTVIKVVRP